MSKDSEEIKTIEQWKWSEMQGLELVNDDAIHVSHSHPTTLTEEEVVVTMDTSQPNKDGGSSSGKKPETETESVPSVGFGELFRFANGWDYILMTIGTFGAIVRGCSLPLFLRFFADLVNSFGSNANNVDKMTQEVVKYAFYFLVVGAAIWASSWAELWMWTGERQSTKMRIIYLEAALKQDIAFFDTEVRTSDVVLAINTDAVMVQDAISEKLGNFIHYMAIVSGFVVRFADFAGGKYLFKNLVFRSSQVVIELGGSESNHNCAFSCSEKENNLNLMASVTPSHLTVLATF